MVMSHTAGDPSHIAPAGRAVAMASSTGVGSGWVDEAELEGRLGGGVKLTGDGDLEGQPSIDGPQEVGDA